MQEEVMPSCPDCGGANQQIIRVPRQIAAEDGTMLPYEDELTACFQCGERFYTREQALQSSRARAGALREYEGLLTPDQIVGIREKYDLSQADLENLLELGDKTVVRWERGTVSQSRAADKLLRLLDQLGPENLNRLVGLSKGQPAIVLEPADRSHVFVSLQYQPLPSTIELAYDTSRLTAAWRLPSSVVWERRNLSEAGPYVGDPAASNTSLFVAVPSISREQEPEKHKTRPAVARFVLAA